MAEAEPNLEVEGPLSAADVRAAWRLLDATERAEGFRLLAADQAEEFFIGLSTQDQLELLKALSPSERRLWMRALAPDDAADLLQKAPPEDRVALLGLLDERTRRDVGTLLAYAEDDAGGLMSPRFARIRPEMTVDEAIIYLRKQADERLETIYYGYVLDQDQRLLGVVSLRELFQAKGTLRVRDMMHTELVTVPEQMDQEQVGRLFAEHDLVALPVLDAEGRMKGIVTVDDIVDVVQEEATEDIQKIGGTEALDAPYLDVGLLRMVKKRASWLIVLFLGEMLTATAMAYYEGEIGRALVLTMFLPLILSSGGNSGSQATTLVIRAMALGEVKVRDWFRIMKRELAAGLALGLILGAIGFLRIVLWQSVGQAFTKEPGGLYGEHYLLVATTVACSLVGVVIWGTFSGSMLPMLLRKLGFDPASASAPFVATMVDVTGLVIYFTFAAFWLGDTLLKVQPA
jgi:magnesium transporter